MQNDNNENLIYLLELKNATLFNALKLACKELCKENLTIYDCRGNTVKKDPITYALYFIDEVKYTKE